MNNILKDLRLKHKLTQEEVANLLNVTTAAYNNYENGKRNIPSSKAKIIAELYKVDINSIFTPCNFSVR